MVIVAVLAGGISTRFFVNKLFYPLKRKPLILYVIDKLRFCKYVVKTIVVASPFNVSLFNELDIDTVVDNMCIGPLGGIYTVLRLFKEVFIVGGDMPNIRCSFIERMISLCKDITYACIPIQSNGYMEPLAAIYRDKLLPIIEYGISIGEYSFQRLIKKLDIIIQVVDIEKKLSDLRDVFVNINRLDDIHRLESF